MTIVDLLNDNYYKYAKETSLVEITAKYDNKSKLLWQEYSQTAPTEGQTFRRELTWEDFYKKANKVANLLLKNGCKKGDKIAILLLNSIEWLPIYFGILKAGAVAVPLNFRYTSEEIEYCLSKADCTTLFFGPEFVAETDGLKNQNIRLFYVGEDCPSFAIDFDKELKEVSADGLNIELDENDDAAIYFSSGTTGFPKAILHTNKSLINAAIVEQKHHSQKHTDVFLCIPPLYHTGAKMHWFGSLLVGGKAVLLRGTKPNCIIKAISDENCSIVWLLVPWAQDILDEIENGSIDLSEYKTEQWRLMHIGAQPVPPSLIKRWKKHFPNQQYDTNYGLSESTGPGCVHLGVENVEKVGAIGKAGYGWKTKIVDDGKQIVKSGEVGELCVFGDGVMKCYYNDEEATESTLIDGWLYTGDMVKEDADGFIYLVDRKKDVIVSGGENIYPVQIENYLRKDEKIKDVAVIGYPDNRMGEIPVAIVELKPNEEMTKEEFFTLCMGLPRYKRPREVFFDKVLRNPTGKIEKPKLREKFCK